jgi:putative transport protein
MFAQILDNPLLTLFLLVSIGLLFGSWHIKGVNLGSSGVIFAALLAGHFGASVPPAAGTVGLVLFVYCVGIGAGGRFFAALKREGSQLAKLALIVVGSGALITWGLAELFNLSAPMAAGIFAGALTSTPALAAAMEGSKGAGSDVVVGYGITYPFGVISVVLFVQLLPRLLKISLEEGGTEDSQVPKVVRQLVEVTNPNLFGRPVSDESVSAIGGCQVSRVWRDGRLEPARYGDTFQPKQLVLLVGTERSVRFATDLIGKPSEERFVIDTEEERQVLTVTSKELRKQTLAELDPLKNHGVVITRVSRMELLFVPDGSTRLEPHDIVTVVGPKQNLESFAKFIGHNPLASYETSLTSLAIGLALGILIGQFQIPLPGGNTFSLGLAGGPLFAALLLGHFGRVGGIVGHIPRPTRMLLQEMGLVFFLADAGIRGGAAMGDTLATNGVQLLLIGAVVSVVPMIIGYWLARRVFGMSLGRTLGGICGGMTSTPALGAIISKTSRQDPIVSYATAYPVAIILMALMAKLLVKIVV